MCLAGATQLRSIRIHGPLSSLCGPQGTRRGSPSRGRQSHRLKTSAAHRSAAMAGGARPDPFRTRKLSRRAPMVLRGQPVGEQGAADRWTALDPYIAGSGAGAPRGDAPRRPLLSSSRALRGPFPWGEVPRSKIAFSNCLSAGSMIPPYRYRRGRPAPFLWRAFLALRDLLSEKAFVLSGAEGPCPRIRTPAAAYRFG